MISVEAARALEWFAKFDIWVGGVYGTGTLSGQAGVEYLRRCGCRLRTQPPIIHSAVDRTKRYNRKQMARHIHEAQRRKSFGISAATWQGYPMGMYASGLDIAKGVVAGVEKAYNIIQSVGI